MVENNMQMFAKQPFKLGTYILLLPAYLLIFCSGFYEPLFYIASAILAIYIFTLTPSETMCYLVFHEFFSGYQVFFMVGIVSCLLNLAARYVVDVARKRKPIFVIPLIITFAILVMFSLIFYEVDTNGVLQGAIIYAVLAGIYLAFAYREQIDAKRCTLAGLAGLLTSLLLSVMAMLIHGYGFDAVVIDSAGLSRFRALTYNPNYLAMLCLFLLSLCIYNLSCRKKWRWAFVTGIPVCLATGLATMSKAFLVVLLCILIYSMVMLILKLKKKSLAIILPAIAASLVCVLCFQGFFESLLQRFVVYGDQSADPFSKAFTGRTEIWKAYISEITSGVDKLLFGVGMFSCDLPINSPHSTILFYLYRVGLIGLSMLMLLAKSYFQCSPTKLRVNMANILPLMVFLLVGLEEMVLNERFFIFLVIGISLLFEHSTTQNSDSDENSMEICKNQK